MNTFKILHLTIFSVVILILASCSEDVYEGAYKPSLESHYLNIYPRDFEFSNGEETKTGSITSENAWSFSSIPSWLTLSPTSGNSNAEFSATSSVNETINGRTAVFYLTANASEWNQQRTITVSQSAASPYFQFVNLENTSVYLNGEPHTLIIDVETNIDDLTTTISDGDDDWLSASYEDNQLTISVNVNDDGLQRSGRVKLWSSTYSQGGTIYITQYKPNLSFNELTSFSFDADGGTQKVKIDSEIPWFALSKESWIEVTPSEGNSGSNQMNISVLPSYQSESRNGKVLFYYKDHQSAVGSISISQIGRYLNLSQTSVTLDSEENSSSTVELNSNISWEISSCPEWLFANPNTGDAGISKITLTAQENSSLNSRSGIITIKDSMVGGIRATLSIVQNGLDFGGQSTIEFNWKASEQRIQLPIPDAWNAAVSDNWIMLSDYSGNGNDEIIVSVSRNDAAQPRTGKIMIALSGTTIEINVVQDGQFISIENETGDFSSQGGSMDLFVSTSLNLDFEIEENSDWFVVNKKDNNTFTIKVNLNNSIKQRNGVLKIKPSDSDVNEQLSQGIAFNIHQSGREISANVAEIQMYSKGGSSSDFMIFADGEYEICKGENDYWFTLIHDPVTNTFKIVCAENETNIIREGMVILSLINLPEGEALKKDIKVKQCNYTLSISKGNYDDDEIIY